MTVKPQIRLIILVLIVLVQFFMIITYSNSLAGANVELTGLQAEISSENLSQGEYRESVAQQLNERLVTEARRENISRINPEETIKLRDIQPDDTNEVTIEGEAADTPNIVAF